jgi:hypothetical protein
VVTKCTGVGFWRRVTTERSPSGRRLHPAERRHWIAEADCIMAIREGTPVTPDFEEGLRQTVTAAIYRGRAQSRCRSADPSNDQWLSPQTMPACASGVSTFSAISATMSATVQILRVRFIPVTVNIRERIGSHPSDTAFMRTGGFTQGYVRSTRSDHAAIAASSLGLASLQDRTSNCCRHQRDGQRDRLSPGHRGQRVVGLERGFESVHGTSSDSGIGALSQRQLIALDDHRYFPPPRPSSSTSACVSWPTCLRYRS